MKGPQELQASWQRKGERAIDYCRLGLDSCKACEIRHSGRPSDDRAYLRASSSQSALEGNVPLEGCLHGVEHWPQELDPGQNPGTPGCKADHQVCDVCLVQLPDHQDQAGDYGWEVYEVTADNCSIQTAASDC